MVYCLEFLNKKIDLFNSLYDLDNQFLFHINYGISPDVVDSHNSQKPNLLLVQAAQLIDSDTPKSTSFLVLPGCTFLEKRAPFINYSGRLQYTSLVFKPLRFSKEDWRIIKLVHNSFSLAIKIFKQYEHDKRILDFVGSHTTDIRETSEPVFFKKRFSDFFQKDNIFFYHSPLIFWLDNFYFTDVMTSSSRLLAVVSKLHTTRKLL